MRFGSSFALSHSDSSPIHNNRVTYRPLCHYLCILPIENIALINKNLLGARTLLPLSFAALSCVCPVFLE